MCVEQASIKHLAQRAIAPGMAQGRGAAAVKDVLERTFAEDGPFAARVPGFRLRSEQLAMAQAVGEAIERTRRADRRGRHRHRQDLRLPRAGAALRRQGDRLDRHQDAAGPALRARPADGARRARVPVQHRAAQGPRELRLPATTSSARRARAGFRRATTRGTSARSRASPRDHARGDRAELADVPENASIWPLVTSTRENCLGQRLPRSTATAS